jgi:hypothetical protein
MNELQSDQADSCCWGDHLGYKLSKGGIRQGVHP